MQRQLIDLGWDDQFELLLNCFILFFGLQIRNMKFIFHVNHDAVKQHIARTRRGRSRGEITAFDWNQNP